METFIKTLTNENVTLTGYIHSKSEEMLNVDIRPAVLIFPGGGYMMCSDREAEPIALAYLSEGYNTFVLRYTVGPLEPIKKAYDDACETMTYLHEHAKELHIDKTKIVVAGFSAGGHLAAWLAAEGLIKPAAVILGYPVTLGRTIVKGKEYPNLLSKVSNNMPQTFIFATRNDERVPVTHSLQYADALDKANVGFELHIFSDGPHALSLAKSCTSGGKLSAVNKDVAQWFALSVNWLKRVIGDFDAC